MELQAREVAVATRRRALKTGLDAQGDQLLAIFGLEVASIEGRVQALLAEQTVSGSLGELHERLEAELGVRATRAVYVHSGLVAVGSIGEDITSALTAVGSAIDAVQRLASEDRQRLAMANTAAHR